MPPGLKFTFFDHNMFLTDLGVSALRLFGIFVTYKYYIPATRRVDSNVTVIGASATCSHFTGNIRSYIVTGASADDFHLWNTIHLACPLEDFTPARRHITAVNTYMWQINYGRYAHIRRQILIIPCKKGLLYI